MYKAVLGILCALACGVAYAATPYIPINCNIERHDTQFHIYTSAFNTTPIRATMYQGDDYFDASGFTAQLKFAKSDSATNMVTITGSVASSNITFTPLTNTLTSHFDNWYAVVYLSKPGGQYTYSRGLMTVRRAPEVQTYANLPFGTNLNGNTYSTFTGSFSHWPFLTTNGSNRMQANLNFGGYRGTNLLDPTAVQDAATLNYVTNQVTTATSALHTVISAEIDSDVTAATGALHTIVSAEIDSDVTTATGALHTIVSAEITAATNANYIDITNVINTATSDLHTTVSAEIDADVTTATNANYIDLTNIITIATNSNYTDLTNHIGSTVTNADQWALFTAVTNVQCGGHPLTWIEHIESGAMSSPPTYPATANMGHTTFGRVIGTLIYSGSASRGAGFRGHMSGASDSVTLTGAGAQFIGLTAGSSTSTVSGVGSAIYGSVYGTATNSGAGSIALIVLEVGETAVLSGNGSLLCTDGNATNSHNGTIVAGETSSSADGTMAAENGFYYGTTAGLSLTNDWTDGGGVVHTQIFLGGLLTSWTTNGVALP